MITRVFRNGNGQAVRIPQALRLDADRVEISRTEHRDLLIRPVVDDRARVLREALGAFDDELGDAFVAQVCADRLDQAPPQEREALEDWSEDPGDRTSARTR